MANTKKTTKTKRSSKKSSPEIVPDFYKDFENGVELSLYDKGDKVTGKIVINEMFVIYVKVVILDDTAFISYPSFKGKDDKYINQAYCFDKDFIAEMNAAVEEYVFEED